MISVLLLLVDAWAQAPAAGDSTPTTQTQATSDISVVIFESGLPVDGVSIVAEGELVGTTDEAGSARATIPSGRQFVQMFDGDEALVELDLLTVKGEVVQVIVTLVPGQEPRLDIETSSDTLPFASERADQPEEEAEPEEAATPGALVGQILSAEDERPVARARVFFSGTDIETRTDNDGEFMVELPAGTYSMSVVHPNFSTQTLDNVRVIAEQEVTANIELTPAGIQLQEYVVTAPYVEGSISEMLAQQRETSSVVEVLGAEQMSAAGDSDAAEALQRVSGLTVEQGKFVLVRGQPYRYTLTLWNGSPLPSPEPLLRIVPLDLFPTGVLSGIEVQKSYSADMPASFGAGLINLQTRGVPEEAFIDLSVSTNYNSVSAFNRGSTYEGGSLDFFGYDDGTRALPPEVAAENARNGTLGELSQEERDRLGKQFPNIYNPDRINLPPDFGISLSGGGSVPVPGDGKVGAVAALRFSNSWRYQDRQQNSYSVNTGLIEYGFDPLSRRDEFFEDRTDNNADVGGMLTVQGIWDRFEVSSNTFYAHQTQQRTQITTGEPGTSDDVFVRDFLLSWIERQLVAQQLSGRAEFGPLRFDARGLFARASRDSPDRRSVAWSDFLPFDPQNPQWRVFGDSGVERQFSTVQDDVQSYGFDATLLASDPLENWLGLTLKTGVAGSRQERTAPSWRYTWQILNESCPEDEEPDRPCGGQVEFDNTNNELHYDPALTGLGGTLLFRDQSAAFRDYIGSQRVFGVYGLADVKLGDILRLVGGLRYERAELNVVTYEVSPDDDDAIEANILHSRACFTTEEVEPPKDERPDPLDEKGAACALYPSASATLFLGEQMQVRAAYGRSTSRPNLNELSDARFVDPETGEQFVGSTDLAPSLINGFDARWEWYPSTTESITFGGFIKDYINPIERAFVAVGGTDSQGTFQNAATARVRGLEFGGRVEPVEDFYVMANVALLDSTVVLRNVGLNTEAERPLDGQAAYTVNVQTGYSGEKHDATIALNVVGRRLHRAGIQGGPGVIFGALPGLNVAWSWDAFESERFVGGIKVQGSNLLNPFWTYTQQYVDPDTGREFDERIWRQYRRGWNLGLSLTFGIR